MTLLEHILGQGNSVPYNWLFNHGAVRFLLLRAQLGLTGVHGQAPPLAELLNSSALSSFHPKSLRFHLIHFFNQYYTMGKFWQKDQRRQS